MIDHCCPSSLFSGSIFGSATLCFFFWPLERSFSFSSCFHVSDISYTSKRCNIFIDRITVCTLASSTLPIFHLFSFSDLLFIQASKCLVVWSAIHFRFAWVVWVFSLPLLKLLDSLFISPSLKVLDILFINCSSMFRSIWRSSSFWA